MFGFCFSFCLIQCSVVLPCVLFLNTLFVRFDCWTMVGHQICCRWFVFGGVVQGVFFPQTCQCEMLMISCHCIPLCLLSLVCSVLYWGVLFFFWTFHTMGFKSSYRQLYAITCNWSCINMIKICTHFSCKVIVVQTFQKHLCRSDALEARENKQAIMRASL